MFNSVNRKDYIDFFKYVLKELYIIEPVSRRSMPQSGNDIATCLSNRNEIRTAQAQFEQERAR